MHRFFYVLFILFISCVGVKAQDEVITDTTKMTYSTIFGKYTYYRVNYTYKSVALDGSTPVTLSSAIVFPQKVFERKKPLNIGGQEYDASGLMLNNHYTITKATDAPTLVESMTVEGAFSVLGPSFIIISPDGYGFGTTVDEPQAYLMADITGRNNVDAVRAARRLLSTMNYTYGDLFVQLGYSQGGHSAMAVQRYVDTHGADPEAIPTIDYTLCGAGPYDIAAMLDSMMLPDARTMYPCALPLVVQGQVDGYGLDISFSDCFPKPLDTKLVEWVNSKKYSTDDINDSIYAIIGGNSKTGALVKDVFLTENFSRDNEKMKDFYQGLEENSLVSGWQPNNATRFYIYHSKQDEVVPHYCMEHMVDFLSNDCGIGEDRLEVYTTKGAHVEAATLFIINAINRLNDLEGYYIAGEYTPISVTNIAVAEMDMPVSGWYNLQGQRLPGRPNSAGLYIHDGKKVVVRGSN